MSHQPRGRLDVGVIRADVAARRSDCQTYACRERCDRELALCARVEALEAALRDVLKWLPADSRGAKQIRAALDGGEP